MVVARVQEPLNLLQGSFYVLSAAFVLIRPLGLIGIIAAFAVASIYLWSLGRVAHHLGKSWIIWVGLTIITSPVGYLFAYPMTKFAANKATDVSALSEPTPI